MQRFIRKKKGWFLLQMPESSADTFWGKGFLATALGTASPDRKKTQKGQFWSFVPYENVHST